jgi:hypothetical protein
MMPPSISISSPQNSSSINANCVQLVFSVAEPQIANLSPNIPPSIIENNGVSNSTAIARVSYKGDWQIEEHILYSNEQGSEVLEFNVTLSNIPNGNHEVEITAIGTVRLIVAMFGFEYHSNSTSSIIFAVNSLEPNNQDTNSPSNNQDANSPLITLSQVVLTLLLVLALTVIALFALKRRSNKKVNKLAKFSLGCYCSLKLCF